MNEPNRVASPRALDFRRLFRAASLALLCAATCAAALARQQAPSQPPQQQPAKPAAPKAPASAQPAPQDAGQSATQKYFSDVELVDQDGRRVRFYSDLLKGKTVVVNAFFATCKGVCAPMSQNLQRVQEAFKERVGKDLHIISITVDPETDTPAMLKAYAKQYGAIPGRYFVTGKKENVDWALYKLGQYVEQKEQHTSIFIVGNEATGLWKKLHGVANISEIVKSVESVLNDKGATGGGAK
ncbi:MAG TPA: SCO family protein [Pyrinomonadaceae bacterium]|nr:SCO family protein [Pyrinomonadaceae bacterium]